MRSAGLALLGVAWASAAQAVDAPVYRHAGTLQPAIGVFCLDLAGAYTGCGGGGSSVATTGIAPVTTTGSSLVAKSGPGTLYGYNATAGATPGFVAVLNGAAAPASGATISPLECSAVSANGTYRTRQDTPDRYTTGIVLLFTASCSTYAAVSPAILTAVVQ